MYNVLNFNYDDNKSLDLVPNKKKIKLTDFNLVY